MALHQPTYRPHHNYHPSRRPATPPPSTVYRQLSGPNPFLHLQPHPTPELTPPKMELAVNKVGGPMGGPMAAPSSGLAGYAGVSDRRCLGPADIVSANGCLAMVRYTPPDTISEHVSYLDFAASVLTTHLPSESTADSPYASVRPLRGCHPANDSCFPFSDHCCFTLHLPAQAQAS